MIKRTVGLRPIKYTKLGPCINVGSFNGSVHEKKAICDSFKRLGKSCKIVDERVLWARWEQAKNGNTAVKNDLDFILLFSHIPHNELKDIWFITGCDKIMKFQSFNRIYNQCVYGQDILWINCKSVDTIEQKIRWDKLNGSPQSPELPSPRTEEQEKIKPLIPTPPVIEPIIPTPITEPKMHTHIKFESSNESESSGSSESSEVSDSDSDFDNEMNSRVKVFDEHNNVMSTYHLPKKIVTELDVSVPTNEENEAENGSCTIL